MCLKVALYHACDHPFKWVWRPCDNPRRQPLADPDFNQLYRFVPCSEGFNARLPAFTSPFSEYRADGKVCRYCEVKVERKLKKAAKEKLRKEECLRVCPWIQKKSDAEESHTRNDHEDGFTDNVKHRPAQEKVNIHKGQKATKHVAFKEPIIDYSAVNTKGVARGASNDSKLCYPDTGWDSWGFKEHRSDEKRRRFGFVNTGERGGKKEAGVPGSINLKMTEESAIKRDAVEQEGTKREWSDLLSQQQSCTTRDAAIKTSVKDHDAIEKTSEGNLEDGKVREARTIREHAVKYEASKVEVTGYKPTIITAVKECVEREYLVFELMSLPSETAKTV